jgi:leukotriene-A4 hydrolase
VALGTALVFSQDTPHEGAPVGAGREKIIIRTDVMFRREPARFEDATGREAYALHRDAQAAEGRGDHMEAMRLYRHCRRLCPAYADFVGIG